MPLAIPHNVFPEIQDIDFKSMPENLEELIRNYEESRARFSNPKKDYRPKNKESFLRRFHLNHHLNIDPRNDLISSFRGLNRKQRLYNFLQLFNQIDKIIKISTLEVNYSGHHLGTDLKKHKELVSRLQAAVKNIAKLIPERAESLKILAEGWKNFKNSPITVNTTDLLLRDPRLAHTLSFGGDFKVKSDSYFVGGQEKNNLGDLSGVTYLGSTRDDQFLEFKSRYEREPVFVRVDDPCLQIEPLYR